MCEMDVKCDSIFNNLQEHHNFSLSIGISTELLQCQCITKSGLRLLLKENQGQNWSYHVVFAFNTLILLLSGIINIFLCKRLRRTRQLHTEVSDPSPPETPVSEASSSLNRISLNLDYTTLQFPEDNTSRENSAIERRKTRRNPLYSSLKCQVSNVTEEN